MVENISIISRRMGLSEIPDEKMKLPLMLITLLIILVLSFLYLYQSGLFRPDLLFREEYQQQPITKRPEHIFYVLPAGGARQLSWISPVVQTLSREGLNPTLIIGSSGGAIMGTALAHGESTKSISYTWKDISRSYYGRTPPPQAQWGVIGYIYRLRKLEKIFPDLNEKLIDFLAFEQLVNSSIGLIINAAHSNNRDPHLFIINVDDQYLPPASSYSHIESQNNLEAALHASSAIPGFLPPVTWHEKELIDGSFSQPTDLKTAFEIAENLEARTLIVYIDANSPRRILSPPTYRQTILLNQIKEKYPQQAILVIRPETVLPGGDYLTEIQTIEKAAQESAKDAVSFLKW